jgi:RNA polymerase sigma-70 factor, ECF subfamily
VVAFLDYSRAACLVGGTVAASSSSPQNITGLLRAWSQGDEYALAELTPLVYNELHRLARRRLSRESVGHTLQTTALINEVYLRLVDLRDVDWQDRAHFFAVCARLMRRILIDLARSRDSLKRGGDRRKVTLEEGLLYSSGASAQLLALDEALNRLAQVDARKSNVVEMRFFGGLTVKETAEVLRVSTDTVMREWGLARAWLMREMGEGQPDAD